MVERPGFYVMEGLDGVGKSTVRELLKQNGFEVLKTPPEDFPVPRSEYDNLPVSDRFLFYLAGVVWASKKIDKIEKRQIICDRYLLTTLAAHEALGLEKDYLISIEPVLKDILRPQVTFLLTADESVRLERLISRGANENDLANFKINNRLLDGYRQWSEKLQHKLIEIDTTFLDPDEVVKFITNEIKKHEPSSK